MTEMADATPLPGFPADAAVKAHGPSLPLGAAVTVTAKLVRRAIWRDRLCRKVLEVETFDQPLAGVLIGMRTLNEGRVDYSGDEISYYPDHWQRAYLVAFDLWRRPVLVPPDRLTLTEAP